MVKMECVTFYQDQMKELFWMRSTKTKERIGLDAFYQDQMEN